MQLGAFVVLVASVSVLELQAVLPVIDHWTASKSWSSGDPFEYSTHLLPSWLCVHMHTLGLGQSIKISLDDFFNRLSSLDLTNTLDINFNKIILGNAQ